MHPIRLIAAAAALAFVGGAAFAQETATCKDGTSWSGAHRTGACRGHHGVQEFGAATPAAAAAAAATPAVPFAAAPSAAGRAPTAVAPGGGTGQVWVNTKSRVYHCPGDRYYGKTKAGAYIAESAAKAAGDRPDHGKTCS